MKKPKKLNKWDSVLALSLSWWGPGSFLDRYLAGKTYLEEEFWVVVIEWDYTKKDPERLYNNPKARADDLMKGFKDPNVKAIIATIWWEDSIRILPYIDFNVIRDNPKIFMWYSDNTITHFMCRKAWLVSFYWPSIMAWFAENGWMFDYTKNSVYKNIFSSDIIWDINPNDSEWWTNKRIERSNVEAQKIRRETMKTTGWRWIQGEGMWSWELIGWCIDVFPFMQWTVIWTKLDEWKWKVLIIETSEEKMSLSSFKRILRNLWSQWILNNINGILMWRSQIDYESWEQINYDETILSVVNWELWIKNLPIVTNMDFGHTDPMMVLPLWCNINIDCDNKKINISENACV